MPNPPDPTTIGRNLELSKGDIEKIQKSYGCDACGGQQFGSEGEIKGGGDVVTRDSSCSWVLKSVSRKKQIILDIKVETTSTSSQ